MRYSRLEPLDIDQTAVQEMQVAVIGLGATGSHMAENLARLGADLVLIDRDYLEPANLSTSALYTEEQVEQHLPKAVAAERQLHDINDEITITSHTADVNACTLHNLLDGADLVMDGTDNLETRFLLNEYSIKTGTPWIHVSALGTSGEVMPITAAAVSNAEGLQPSPPAAEPNSAGGACFNCIFADKDGAALETCETAGILKETASTAANIATANAVALLSGNDVSGLTRFNLQTSNMRTLSVNQCEDCNVCVGENYPHLAQDAGSVTASLCGREKYQVNPVRDADINLKSQRERLTEKGSVSVNEHLLRFESDAASFTLFRNGRAIIEAENEEAAKIIYSRFIGN